MLYWNSNYSDKEKRNLVIYNKRLLVIYVIIYDDDQTKLISFSMYIYRFKSPYKNNVKLINNYNNIFCHCYHIYTLNKRDCPSLHHHHHGPGPGPENGHLINHASRVAWLTLNLESARLLITLAGLGLGSGSSLGMKMKI